MLKIKKNPSTTFSSSLSDFGVEDRARKNKSAGICYKKNKNNTQFKTGLLAVVTRLFLLLIFVAQNFLIIVQPAKSQVIKDIEFPIRGEYQPFTDSYGDPRSGGRSHIGIDILAAKMTPLVAVVDGVVTFAPKSEPYWGYALYIKGDDGWEYRYLHINNDTPGTDDNAGGFKYDFAPGISKGVRVARGQLVAYIGDSGNAEWVTPHLHFEIHRPGGSDGDTINPYESLVAASSNIKPAVINYDPALAREAALSISIDKRLEPSINATLPCTANSLIKSP